MGAPSNTFDAYTAKGIREDLSDIIYRIDPDEVPFTSNIGRSKATAKKHEWQTQALAAATNTNAVIEGDDATTDAATPTVRVGNYTQISDKVAQVTGTLEAVDKAGRDSEMRYQVMLKGLELRRDVEAQLTSNKASVVGGPTTAAQSAGFESWLTSNTSRGTTGANGGFSQTSQLVAAPTDDTSGRSWTETMLKDVQKLCKDNGGKPTIIMMGSKQKQVFSTFTGIAQIRKDAPSKGLATIIGGADVYVGDFGNLSAVTNIFQRVRTVFLVDPKMVKMATLRPMKNWDLAKTGDTTRRQILLEYSLEVCNQGAHGVIADLQPLT